MQKEPMARYQTATAMLRDLAQALKNPDGEFVEKEDLDDGLTRRMDAITDDMTKNAKSSNKKKKNKVAIFFENHPKTKVLAIIALCLIIFAGSIAITSAILKCKFSKRCSNSKISWNDWGRSKGRTCKIQTCIRKNQEKIIILR